MTRPFVLGHVSKAVGVAWDIWGQSDLINHGDLVWESRCVIALKLQEAPFRMNKLNC